MTIFLENISDFLPEVTKITFLRKAPKFFEVYEKLFRIVSSAAKVLNYFESLFALCNALKRKNNKKIYYRLAWLNFRFGFGAMTFCKLK